jgi:hypothetical protein
MELSLLESFQTEPQVSAHASVRTAAVLRADFTGAGATVLAR